MPDSVEQDIFDVLKGEGLLNEEAAICDFSLEDQNAALESQGVTPRIDPNKKPILQDTIVYIVAAVLFNEHDEVLMIQEAKENCAGKWYLPAGRMEKGETIVEATVREVLEETHLNVDCRTLLMVECAQGSWFRFVLTGVVTGGSLKTPSEADKESLQAKWIKDLKEVPLRSGDISHLVDRARAYSQAVKNKEKSWHLNMLPALRPHTNLLLRLVVVIKKKSNNKVHVLLSERTSWHLPVCEIHPTKSLHSTLRRFMVEIFGADVAAHRPHGVLSVEHNGQTSQDGLCLTMLVAFRAALEEVPIIGKCMWHETSRVLGDTLMVRVVERNSTFPLNVIR